MQGTGRPVSSQDAKRAGITGDLGFEFGRASQACANRRRRSGSGHDRCLLVSVSPPGHGPFPIKTGAPKRARRREKLQGLAAAERPPPARALQSLHGVSLLGQWMAGHRLTSTLQVVRTEMTARQDELLRL